DLNNQFVALTDRQVEQTNQDSEDTTLRSGYIILAALLAALTIAPHALVLRRRPEDLRLRPDGAAAGDAPRPAPLSVEGAPLATALHDAAFWWLAGAFFAGTLTTVAVGVYLIPYLVARGDDPGFAAAVTGLIGAAQVVARVGVTLVGHRQSQATLTAGVFALQAVALLVLLLSDAAVGVVAAVLLLGAGRGAVTLLRPGIVADRYGMAHFGAINGALAFFLVGAQALAPFGAGIVATWCGRYEPVLWGLAGVALVAAGAMLGMSRVKRPPGAAAPAGTRSTPAD
ncbi:MAG TPA: MFS transporter, partial [Thermomicrobiales bacterium]|nr:MFS transporter [Thermomicrobiales bacterium]